MKNKTTSTRKKRDRLSHGLGYLLFSETIGIRLFRIWVMLLVIVGWGGGGALIFEVNQGGLTVVNILRYSLAPLAAIVSSFLLGARYLQDIYELPSYASALRYLFASMFDGPPYSIFLLSGLSLPTLNISDGNADVADEDINLLQRIGGPGWLSVEAGNVVLLEYLHGPARVLGSGFHFVPRMQHVESIFTLEERRWEANPIIATTKDGIEVAVHDFQFGYRLAPSLQGLSTKKRTVADPYPFSIKAVWKLAYNRSVREDGTPMEWGKVAQFRLDGIITDLINRYSIDKILAPILVGFRASTQDDKKDASELLEGASQEYHRSKDKIPFEDESPFKNDIRRIILNQLRSSYLHSTIMENIGTDITWINIGRFEVNDNKIRDDIKNYRLKAWFANLAGKAELIRAEGKAEQISQRESGRIEKTASMLRSILQALDDANLDKNENNHLWNIVLARTAQIIEAMASVYGMDILGLDSMDKRKEHHES